MLYNHYDEMEKLDQLLESSRDPRLNQRDAGHGTARGVYREYCRAVDRPEEQRRAYRDLVAILGEKEAHDLVTRGPSP